MSEQIRERVPETKYTEFQVDSRTYSLITDVANERAWIQSDTTESVQP